MKVHTGRPLRGSTRPTAAEGMTTPTRTSSTTTWPSWEPCRINTSSAKSRLKRCWAGSRRRRTPSLAFYSLFYSLLCGIAYSVIIQLCFFLSCRGRIMHCVVLERSLIPAACWRCLQAVPSPSRRDFEDSWDPSEVENKELRKKLSKLEADNISRILI